MKFEELEKVQEDRITFLVFRCCFFNSIFRRLDFGLFLWMWVRTFAVSMEGSELARTDEQDGFRSASSTSNTYKMLTISSHSGDVQRCCDARCFEKGVGVCELEEGVDFEEEKGLFGQYGREFMFQRYEKCDIEVCESVD